jgi:hypothetical protein
MRSFSIHIVNSDLESSNTMDAGNAESARSAALKGALEIGAGEVCKGIPFFGAEISIKDGDEVVERLMVAIGTSNLKLPGPGDDGEELQGNLA